MHRVALLIVLAAACGKGKPARNLDLDLVRVTEAHLRTDTVGGGKFSSTATFVLVDAENRATEGAYVSLGGELDDDAKKKVGDLTVQSLWIPAGATRTFALVDSAREPRPGATAARIVVRGALVPETPPVAHVDDIKEIDDRDKIVVQGTLVNDIDRPGQVMVIGSFHDERGQPMTRPFYMVDLPAKGRVPVQFVGPVGSKHATAFVGDVIF